MAMKPACDVFGVVAGVKKTQMVLRTLEEDGTWKTQDEYELDMCLRALERASKAMGRAASPPTPRRNKEEAAG